MAATAALAARARPAAQPHGGAQRILAKSAANLRLEALRPAGEAAPVAPFRSSASGYEARRQAPVTEGDIQLPAAELTGILEGPGRADWFYTASLTVERIPLEGGYAYDENILGMQATIYNHRLEPQGTIDVEFPQLENSIKINYVEVSPIVTTRFFNTDEACEVMIMANYNFADYHTEQVTLVYSLTAEGAVAAGTYSGYYINALNAATAEGGERYYMMFYNGEEWTTRTWYERFTLMGPATDDESGAQSLYRARINGMLLQGTGDESTPMLLAAAPDGTVYLAAGAYEKTYWRNPDNFEDNTVNPDNNFAIRLFKVVEAGVEAVAVTKIPVDAEPEDCGFRFPWVGMFAGNGDLTFGQYGVDADAPCYVVTQQNLSDNLEEGSYTFEVYDLEGNKLKTLASNTMGYLRMADLPGRETQYCFLYAEDDGSQTMEFVDLPSGNVAGEMSRGTTQIEALTLDFDRTLALDGRVVYAGSMAYGLSDDNDNTLHRAVWYDEHLDVDHIDYVNLGQNVQNAMVLINSAVLAPTLLCADAEQEYLFFVQRNEGNTEATSLAHTELLVVNAAGDNLAQVAFEASAYSVSAMPANVPRLVDGPVEPYPTICYMYQSDETHRHLAFITLPLAPSSALALPTADQSVAPVEYYNLSGVRLPSAPVGTLHLERRGPAARLSR